MKLSCNEQFLTGKRSNVGVSHTWPAVYMRSANSMYMVFPWSYYYYRTLNLQASRIFWR